VSKKFNHYLGKAGHLTIMSEFLMLGWNVAIPEVDIGDDIFVVQDSEGTLRRVQVKTSISKLNKKGEGFSAQFSISKRNLLNVSAIKVHYVFIVRHNNEWGKPIIIRQDKLLDYFDSDVISSSSNKDIVLYFAYSRGKVTCSKQDFTKFVKDFSDFPSINH